MNLLIIKPNITTMRKDRKSDIFHDWKKLPKDYSWHEPTGRTQSDRGVNAWDLILGAMIIGIIIFSFIKA